MQVELHVQPGTMVDPAALIEFARRAVPLEHPALVKILDVGLDDAGCAVLVTPAAAGPRWELHRIASPLIDPATACSIGLSLAEALDYLHRAQFRGGMSLSWDESVRAVRGGDGKWHLAVMPPTPAQVALASTPSGFTGVARYGAPELLSSPGTIPTPASDSFTLAALLFELLTGERLIRAKFLEEIIRELLAGEYPKVSDLRPDLPGALGDFLARALQLEPGARPSLPEWSAAMKQFGGQLLPQPALSPDDTVPELRAKEKPRFRLISFMDDSGYELRLRLADPPRVGGFGGLRAALQERKPEGLEESWNVPFKVPVGGATNKGLASLTEKATEDTRGALLLPASIALENQERTPAAADADPVDCTVFAPPTAQAGESILVQVYAHMPDQSEQVVQLAREADESARRLGFRSLEVEIPRGTKLQIELTLPGVEIEDSVQQVVWRGRATSVQFAVDLPQTQPPGKLIGRVAVYCDGTPIGHVRFKLEITAGDRPLIQSMPRPLGDEARHYSHAFLSYAMKDLNEVMKRVQMLARCHISFFQDILALEPGERWERKLYAHIDECDVFMLFWSTASKESKWVRQEVEYALNRKGSDDSAPPEIVPILLEGPPIPLPPPELSHIHFNDRLLYYMQNPKPQ
jgi:hypothetical protein